MKHQTSISIVLTQIVGFRYFYLLTLMIKKQQKKELYCSMRNNSIQTKILINEKVAKTYKINNQIILCLVCFDNNVIQIHGIQIQGH